MLEIKNLNFTVSDENGPVQILKNINLSVEDQKFVVITGPNGGGKTTLAKIIMGIEKPSSGTIIWNGTDITELSVTERARLGVSYGFQQPPRFKGLLVSDLLEIGAGRSLSRDECCQYLTRVGLCSNDYLDREVDSSLSGGEVKRIEIASILAKEGSLLIFDEPEAGIDLWSFSRLTETFSGLHKTGKATIIVISHQERIISLADEVVMIGGGEIAGSGPANEILPLILANTVGGCSYLGEEGTC